MTDIKLHPVTSERDWTVLRFFFVAFFSDLSQYDGNIVLNRYGLPVWKPTWDEQGGDGPTTIEECAAFNWWVRDLCYKYLIFVQETPVGFALILPNMAPMEWDVDLDLLDFYIAPKYRRAGIGRTAARLLFDRHRGHWQVFQLSGNQAAIAFWHRIIDEYTNGAFELRDNGTQQRFDNTQSEGAGLSKEERSEK